MKRYPVALTAIVIVAISSFGFIKESKVVLGMALLETPAAIDFAKIVDELQSKQGLTVTGKDVDNEKGVGVFKLRSMQVAIARVDGAIPGKELEFPTQVSYLWPEAKDMVPGHKAHIIISVTSQEASKLDMYKAFTKVAAAVLTTTNAFGIYLGSQTLVLSREFYVQNAGSMTDDSLPIMNWIYLGIRDDKGRNSGYTFGLKEFGFDEVEILRSKHSKEEIIVLLYDLSHYIVSGNVTLKHGETIGMTADQKLKVTRSPGVQLDGTTLKIDY